MVFCIPEGVQNPLTLSQHAKFVLLYHGNVIIPILESSAHLQTLLRLSRQTNSGSYKIQFVTVPSDPRMEKRWKSTNGWYDQGYAHQLRKLMLPSMLCTCVVRYVGNVNHIT